MTLGTGVRQSGGRSETLDFRKQFRVKPGAKLKVTPRTNAQRFEFRVSGAAAQVATDVARKIWVS